ncbi:carbonic anhydrase [Sporosarcina koreensis]|uniref:carbonic anhydrase n=1 Tax=Sporosarcina koreensis TaxID=334735 RepID=A0ABW0TY13_9BACL
MKKNFLYSFLVVLLGLLLGACSEQTTETTTPKKEELTDTTENEATESDAEENEATESNTAPDSEWSYDEETGPDHWGDLDPTYSACTDGNEQSPINIETSEVNTNEKLENIEIHYEPTEFSIVNNGYTVQANPATENNIIVLDGKEYKLAQFHFHTPSEHQFDGKQLDMELHLVHQDANGELAVLGLMIKEGKENESLAPIWGVLPNQKTESDIAVEDTVDLQSLLPSDQTTFNYNGSLTTPPCTEEVKWIVFEEPIEMSKEQIQAYQQIFHDNDRPVQPLNDREVFEVK